MISTSFSVVGAMAAKSVVIARIPGNGRSTIPASVIASRACRQYVWSSSTSSGLLKLLRLPDVPEYLDLKLYLCATRAREGWLAKWFDATSSC